MAIYYHVSCDINHSGKFEPRVPESIDECEDPYTKRICVAPSIEQCLTSMPGGSCYLKITCLEDTDYFFKVFKIDTEKLGIKPSDMVPSKTLFEDDLVYDADITGECWITVPFQVPEEDTFVILLQEWEIEKLYAYPFSFYSTISRMENFDGDLLKAYKDIYKRTPDVVYAITDLEYVPKKIKKGEYAKLNIESAEEKIATIDYLRKYWGADILYTTVEKILFKAKQTIPLEELAQHCLQYANY